MQRIKIAHAVVDLEGDEMALVIWRRIKALLIEPHLDIALETYDLGILNRDRTADAVTREAAQAILRTGAGIKCATINPDASRRLEFGLGQHLKSCNGAIRGVIGGTIFREPIVSPGVPALVSRWTKPIIVARHGFGDLYSAVETAVPGAGKLTIHFEGVDASGAATKFERKVFDYPGPGVALAIYNLNDSFREYARACLSQGLARRLPVIFSTKNTVLKLYDERFKQIFQETFDDEFRNEFERCGLTYEHRLIDDMVAATLKGQGGFLWACKNYDGDVQSDFVAQGFGSLGLMTSALVARGGAVVMTEAAHGTITRHYRDHQAGRRTSTNPIASVFAWSRGLAHRADLDGHAPLGRFAERLEWACLDTVAAGVMTKDLAQLVGPRQGWVTTDEFLDQVAERLRQSRQAEEQPALRRQIGSMPATHGDASEKHRHFPSAVGP
jgi:isocitrate dehydrogenase